MSEDVVDLQLALQVKLGLNNKVQYLEGDQEGPDLGVLEIGHVVKKGEDHDLGLQTGEKEGPGVVLQEMLVYPFLGGGESLINIGMYPLQVLSI